LVVVCLLAIAIYVARTSNHTKTKVPVAVVAGRTIYEDDLLPLVGPQLQQLRNKEYELESSALDSLVDQRLLEAAAKNKGIPVEKFLEREMDAKAAQPTETELTAAYLRQKDRLKRPFDDVKPQLQDELKQAKIQEARREYLDRLREQGGVSILLRPPRVQVAYDRARLRGSPQAPVMIVEFSDFQCPFCRQVEPTLENLLAKYGGRVSLAYRDFPLREIHGQAQLAAEASRCAGEQGKFWEYHDLLFANPDKLNGDGLVEHARSLKLDEKQFDSCLSSGRYRGKIEEDLQEGASAGVNGTPGFFINGSFLSGAEPEAEFDRIIQAELRAPRDRRPLH
jgi:protein-disulfide isomerase